jgi:GNAT superfamily N-acetyltransferase
LSDIAIATWDDFPDICQMMRLFGDTYYKDYFTIDDFRISESVTEYLNSLPSERIILLARKDNQNVGLIGGVCTTPPISSDRVAFEMAWWMEPEYRNSRLSLKLLDAYEYWSKHVAKADSIQVCSVVSDHWDTLDKFYKKKGFSHIERSYVRTL